MLNKRNCNDIEVKFFFVMKKVLTSCYCVGIRYRNMRNSNICFLNFRKIMVCVFDIAHIFDLNKNIKNRYFKKNTNFEFWNLGLEFGVYATIY